MPRPHDPISVANEAMSGLLQADSFLTSLNWKPWENNADAENLPRGWVNTKAKFALTTSAPSAAIGTEMGFEFEVVVEAKPKVTLDPEIMASIVGHLIRPDLSNALNGRISDGSLTFNTQPEDFSGSQEISGDTRVYKMSVVIYASWNVRWSPDI